MNRIQLKFTIASNQSLTTGPVLRRNLVTLANRANNIPSQPNEIIVDQNMSENHPGGDDRLDDFPKEVYDGLSSAIASTNSS